ncbi:hypothetical protein [Candidatus Kryptonium thompsonii]|uniref:hypothetical protein n=1 Tax=Candidatus Kryptonium thompsonii TaxID=1633631 RepID=UPI001146E900|nr:hypothetical protein [Candidatus Kryptonium thompsoni]
MIKLDLRTKKEGKISYGRIILILTTNFIWFLMLSFSIAVFEAGKQNLFSFLFGFSFIIFSLELLLIFFTILVEFDTIVLNPIEVELFSALPVDSIMYSLAKYMNFLFFVFLLSFSFNFSPTIVLLLAKFFIPEAYGFSFAKISIAYFITSLLYVVSISNLVLLVMIFLGRGFKITKLKKFILPFQILSVFAIFFAYQIINRYFTTDEGKGAFNLFSDKTPYFISFLPQYIFSKIFVFMSGVGRNVLGFIDCILIGAMLLIFLISPIFVLRIENIQNILSELQPDKNKLEKYLALTVLKRFRNIFFKSGSALAVYELVYIHLRRDKSIKVKILSAFVISIAIAVYFLFFEDIKNPILEPISRANAMMLISLFFNVTAGVTTIQNHRDYEANWVFNYINANEIYISARSGLMVLWHHILFPVVIIFFFVYLIKLGELVPILLHFLVTLILLKIFFNFIFLIFAGLPLSQPVEKLSSSDKILAQIFTIIAVMIALSFEKMIYGFLLKFENYGYVLFFLTLTFLLVAERYSAKLPRQKMEKILNVQ